MWLFIKSCFFDQSIIPLKAEPKYLKVKVKIKDTKVGEEVELAPRDFRSPEVSFNYSWIYIKPLLSNRSFSVVENKKVPHGPKNSNKGVLSLKDKTGKVYQMNFSKDTPILLVKRVN